MLTRFRVLLKDARMRAATAAGSGDGRVANVGGVRATDWRAMVDAFPDGAVVLDAASRVQHINSGFAELYPGVRIGQPLSRWLRNPELIEAIDAAAAGKPQQVVVLAERLPVERRIAARIVKLPSSDATSERAPALLVTFRDLSEQDKLAQMRQDFIANASHELRTPLASLKGFIETLQGPARDDPAARERFLTLMAGQAERMTRLIDDLLSLSRVEMRAHLPPRGIVELNEVASYVLQTIEPMAAATGQTVTLRPSERPARVRGERDEIVQVLTNLLHNAITYGRGAEPIEVAVNRVAAPGGGRHLLKMSVTDHGPGISPEHLPRLTERFYRANVATSRSKGGTGLGLAIVKHIIARHRGELEISSVLGSGSTFAVVLDELI